MKGEEEGGMHSKMAFPHVSGFKEACDVLA